MTDITITQPVEPQAEPTQDNLVRSRREALGVGRSGLAELTGLTPAKIWRIEGGRPNGDELEVVNAMLTNLETNGLPERMQPRRKSGEPKIRRRTRSELEQMVTDINEALDAGKNAKTAKELRELVEKIREVVAVRPVDGVEL